MKEEMRSQKTKFGPMVFAFYGSPSNFSTFFVSKTKIDNW